MTMSEPDEDAILAELSDYLDGAVPADRRPEIEKKIAEDLLWKRIHGELRETRDALSGLHKARAPATFTEDVTGTIHKRSAGKFFARRTLGDRVPFGALLIVALAVVGVVGYLMWSSSTGSLKVEPKRPAPTEPSGPLVE
jgi:anti-sigma factor RsiW